MKKNTPDTLIAESVRKFTDDMGGVFSTSDLHNVIGSGSRLTNQRVISRLVRDGILIRCQRGIYVTKDFNLWLLAARIEKNCYISMDSVLTENGLIGTLRPQCVSVVAQRRAKSLRFAGSRIDFYQASKELYFGFSLKKGVAVADNEKAFLDLLYYHMRGYRFAIDPRVEVMMDRLDKKKIALYLKKYKNPKFVSFVKGVLDGE